ncbi:MAG: hypothetical protein ACLUDU_09840 [Butyricimonas faecihominis]
MKQIILLIAISSIFMLTSCYNEGDVTPSGNYSVLRLEFPQGNNSWDKEIKDIHDVYGLHIKVLPPKILIANGLPWVQANYITEMI